MIMAHSGFGAMLNPDPLKKFELEKWPFLLNRSEFPRNRLVMLSVSNISKNAYSAGKTSGVLKGGVSGANRGYMLAHCRGGQAFSSVRDLQFL